MCKALEDYVNEKYKESFAQGFKEGFKTGFKEGFKRGIIEGKVEVINNMLKMKYTLEDALDCAGLDRQTYEKYANQQ